MNRFPLEQLKHDYVTFAKKLAFFLTKPIFILLGTLTSKIVTYGTQKTHSWSYRRQCSYYEWLFDTVWGVEASFVHISLKIKKKSVMPTKWRQLNISRALFVMPRYDPSHSKKCMKRLPIDYGTVGQPRQSINEIIFHF